MLDPSTLALLLMQGGERNLHEFGRDIPAQVRIVDARHEPVTGLQEAKVCGRWRLDQNGTHWRKQKCVANCSNAHQCIASFLWQI